VAAPRRAALWPGEGRKQSVSRLAFLLVLAAALRPGAAAAHPHVFIDNRVTFILAGQKITGFRENWLFDEVFSDQLLQQFDADQDGVFSPAESAQAAAGTLPSLANFHYFTYAWVDGKDLGRLEPSDFHASASKRLVTFDFLVKLPGPVDPTKQAMALEINDRSYYVEVLLAKQEPIRFQGQGSLACSASVTKDIKNAYYAGFVYPQRIAVQCR
jgi:ABC-type uncharacterized transport system substrate-binding protein